MNNRKNTRGRRNKFLPKHTTTRTTFGNVTVTDPKRKQKWMIERTPSGWNKMTTY